MGEIYVPFIPKTLAPLIGHDEALPRIVAALDGGGVPAGHGLARLWEEETWPAAGADGPPADTARRGAPPPEDTGGAGDRFRWDRRRGWIALARALAEDTSCREGTGHGDGGETEDPRPGIRARAGALALVAAYPHLATAGTLVRAGLLTAEQAGRAAPRLAAAWAEALGDDGED